MRWLHTVTALMKRKAVLLNLGRGPIINDADLASCDMAVELC